MRIKFLSVIFSCLFLPLLMVSCFNDDDEEYSTSTDATIRRFSINNITTQLISDTDTTTFTVTGSNYGFSIDQLSPVGLIYNKDSLPINTDITKVSYNITTFSSNPISYKLKDMEGNDSLCWVSSTDSLDFTEPIIFTVYAYDGITTRDYQVKINVHQVVPDSMVWREIENTNFPGTSINGKQKAVKLNSKVFVFADDDSQVKVTSTTMNDELNWSSLTPLNGLSNKANYSSVIAFQNRIYLIDTENQLYSSSNGEDWINENQQIEQLIGAFSNKLLGIFNNKFIQGVLQEDNTLTWEETSIEKPSDFPISNYVYMSETLSTNSSIERLVVMGEMPNASDTAAVAWNLLSSENSWVKYAPDNIYYCPNLENLALIPYDNSLYAFGGKDRSGNQDINSFENFYYSIDNGKTWRTFQKNVYLPEEFKGKQPSFSYIVDEDQFIWVMWSGENNIWKGRINRLGFTN